MLEECGVSQGIDMKEKKIVRANEMSLIILGWVAANKAMSLEDDVACFRSCGHRREPGARWCNSLSHLKTINKINDTLVERDYFNLLASTPFELLYKKSTTGLKNFGRSSLEPIAAHYSKNDGKSVKLGSLDQNATKLCIVVQPK